jgi:hypothetical protein
MFRDHRCEGCPKNTKRFAMGCEAYTELPNPCVNWPEKYKKEKKVGVYYHAYSGACGKFMIGT